MEDAGGETGMEVCANFECTRLSKGWFIVGQQAEVLAADNLLERTVLGRSDHQGSSSKH